MRISGKDILWLLAGCAFGVLVLPAIIFIQQVVVPWWEAGDIPSYVADENDAEAEAKWLLHNAREAVQLSITHDGQVPIALSGDHPGDSCGLPLDELTGQHYVLVNGVDVMPDGRLQVVAVPLVGNYPLMRLHFYPGDSMGETVAEPHPNRERR